MAKGCLEASLITGKKQVRTPVSYQLVPVRGAGIQKAQITRAGEGVEQWEGLCTIEGTKWVQPLWRQYAGSSGARNGATPWPRHFAPPSCPSPPGAAGGWGEETVEPPPGSIPTPPRSWAPLTRTCAV